MSVSDNNVDVSETEGVQYFVTLPVVIYGQFSIDRQDGLTKNELLSSITTEDIRQCMDNVDNPDVDGFVHTLTWKDKGDTLFWYNDIRVENAQTCVELS